VIRLLPLALLALTLEGCPSKQDIASASALPAYNIAAQAILDRNTAHPFTADEKVAVKAADQKLYDAAIILDAGEKQKAQDRHLAIQGL
jgi:hypothetical protein